MGHTQQFWSFRNREVEFFALEPLITVLERYGCEVGEDAICWHVATPINESGNDEIGSEGGIGVVDGKACDFSIDRPYYDEKFFALAADLVCELGLVMFSEAGTGTYINDASLQPHIPEDISLRATVIKSKADLIAAFDAH
ncbi:hypothetical protein NA78x_001186 [Anatilimnocola sp. NA78]|uniref:hypothetical protein n=1 Tax=Anatilimnocola sp. NA78 TaxID=3415683 RepID=UPI003CE4BB36